MNSKTKKKSFMISKQANCDELLSMVCGSAAERITRRDVFRVRVKTGEEVML